MFIDVKKASHRIWSRFAGHLTQPVQSTQQRDSKP